MSKCKTCEIYKELKECSADACCIWFMDNVVLGDKTIEDCTEYKPYNTEKGGKRDVEIR